MAAFRFIQPLAAGNFDRSSKPKAMKTAAVNSRIIILVAMIIISHAAGAQKKIDSIAKFSDTSAMLLVKTADGYQFIGKFREVRSDTLYIFTADLGKVHISNARIKKIQQLEYTSVKKGKYWFPNPLPGRYFFAPSAFTLSPGEGYYQNTMVALNSFNVGVTNWFSVGGGIEFFSTVATLTMGDFKPTFFITPKIGFKVARNFRLGAGVLYAQIVGDQYKLGTFYGIATYGNSDYNLSLGVGWGYSLAQRGSWEWQKNPLITACGTARLARKLAFVTENWFLPGVGKNGGYYPVFSYGLRFMGESISTDLAFINSTDIAKVFFIGVPFVSFTVKF